MALRSVSNIDYFTVYLTNKNVISFGNSINCTHGHEKDYVSPKIISL